jgi:hypothetical protein
VVVDGAFVVAEGVHARVGGDDEHVGEHVDGRTEVGTGAGCVERIEEEFVSVWRAAQIVVEGGLVYGARGVVLGVVAVVP